MSVFGATYTACQQMSLLNLDEELAAAQAARDLTEAGVEAFFALQAEDMRRAGHRVELRRAASSATAIVLSWRLPGRYAHPRDAYALAVQMTGAGASAQFYGPSRNVVALRLATRHLTIETLSRWTATFFEWALTTREGR